MAAPYQGGPSGGAGEINRVQEVQLQVEEVQGVMRENVSQMLSNYEKAEVLEDKAGAPQQYAEAERAPMPARRSHPSVLQG
mmetsp:Transcript_10321/g.26847  ORF Transcript_10321/g.26847 Transcript_10321/m.26847 type:complete len:81 (-) Transcript_10321:608-850(-)